MSYAPNAGNETDRGLALRRLMATTGSRRAMLKAAAAAGLIPVLTSGEVAARAAAQNDQPVRGGSFVTIGHHDVVPSARTTTAKP